MSEQDFFDGGVIIPGFSWDGMAKGTTVTGVLAKPHETAQQTDIEGKPKTYDDGKPMLQAVLTLQTDYRNFEHVSDKYLEKAKEDGLEDDGLRKLYVRGSMKTPSLNKGLRDALRKAGAKAPEVGATISVTFVKKTPIPNSQFKANDFEVAYESPTAASRAKVADSTASATSSSGGGFAGHDAASDEPPF